MFLLYVRVQVNPVTGDINCHAELEPKGLRGIELRECHQKTHRSDTVRQLVEYRAELCALIEVSGGVSIECVQQRTEDVAPNCNNVVRRHEVEGDQSQDNSAVA